MRKVSFILWLILVTVCLSISLHSCHAEEMDYGRTCLALIGYSEARSEGLVGMIATEQVVLNRLATGNFGESICDVAFGNGQFEGLTDWPIPRIAPEHEAWNLALDAADRVLSDTDALPESCKGAIFFSRIPPKQILCKIGSHYFSK